MAARDKFIALAQSQVGVTETGTNVNKYAKAFDGEWWQWFNTKKQGASWCAIFICWLFCTLIGPEKALKFLGCPAPKNNCAAGVPYLWKYLTALGWEVRKTEGREGDIIFFNDKTHVGMIEAVIDGKYHTIEGNKHNKVSRCVYPTNSASIYGICRPDWSKIEDQPTPTPTPTSTKYKVKVKTVLNVRRGPGVKYAIVDKLKNGTVVKVYEKSGNWGRIGEARWCCMTYLKKI